MKPTTYTPPVFEFFVHHQSWSGFCLAQDVEIVRQRGGPILVVPVFGNVTMN